MKKNLKIRHLANYEGFRTIMLVVNIPGITELIKNFQNLADDKDEVNLCYAFYPDNETIENLKFKVTSEQIGLEEVLNKNFTLQLTTNSWNELMSKLKNYKNSESEKILLIHKNENDNFQVILNTIRK